MSSTQCRLHNPGELNVILIHCRGIRELPDIPEIRLSSGGIKFSFTTVDPSRHVVLYTLSGKKIADIPAFTRTADLNYLKQGIGMRNGMYAVQIVSEGYNVSKKVYITK